MSYDPFSRGPHPAGVVSIQSEDAARGRKLPLELWYPASDAHRGLTPAHLDAHLGGCADAAALLADAERALADRGIGSEQHQASPRIGSEQHQASPRIGSERH